MWSKIITNSIRPIHFEKNKIFKKATSAYFL